MPGPSDQLQLLLAHADDGGAVLDEGLSERPAPEEPEVADPDGFLGDRGADPGSLAAQRWGVLAPDTEEGRRLVAAVDALIAHRSQQATRRLEPFYVPTNLTEVQAHRWRKTVFEPSQDDPLELPGYLLILGDLDGVSLETQQVMAGEDFVGRLACDPIAGRDDPLHGYAAYADKVLRHEGAPSAQRAGEARFYTVQDGTAATELGDAALVRPGTAQLLRWAERGTLRRPARAEAGTDPQALLRLAEDADPAVLFTVSHGLGAPRRGWQSRQVQRQQQGALSFGAGERLSGSELPERFLPGGLWFMLACFGAGTPASSAYVPWIEQLAGAGEAPSTVRTLLRGLPGDGDTGFIGALPKAALASEHGPLGVIGHVDLAWSYAFEELDGGPLKRATRFMELVRSASHGDRFGVAFRWLHRFLGVVNDEVSAHYQQASQRGVAPDARTLGHLWMLRNDLAGYVLLGDPAAQLPLATASAAPRPRASLGGFFGLAPPPPAALPETLEEAIAEVLLGEAGLADIARRHGIDRQQLKDWARRYQQAGRQALGIKR